MLLAIALLTSLAAVEARITDANWQAALNNLPGVAQQAIDYGGVPGMAIAVVYNNTLQYSGGFGLKLVGTNDTVDAETVFQMASVSKPLSSTVVAAIVSKGGLSWSSRVNSPSTIASYSDPWISDQMQISDCFSHRTGLFGTAGDDIEFLNYNRSSILSRLKFMAPAGDFRLDYAYSNYGLTLGAEAAAASTGMSWEDVSQQYLFDPLGMSSTSYRYSDFIGRTNRAALHIRSTSNTSSWMPNMARNPDAQSPAGGSSSNVLDMAKWLLLHLNNGKSASGEQLAAEAPLNATKAPHIVKGTNPITGEIAFYGYGWNVIYPDGQLVNDHAGAFSQGARTYVKINPEEGLGIVVLANCFPTGWPEALSDIFFDTAIYGQPRRDYVTIWNGLYDALGYGPDPYTTTTPPNTGSMLDASAYAGNYKNGYIGRVVIAPGDSGGLSISFPGSSNQTFSLTHWDRDTFYFAPGQQVEPSGVFFSTGADGNATTVVIEILNGNGGGILERDRDTDEEVVEPVEDVDDDDLENDS